MKKITALLAILSLLLLCACGQRTLDGSSPELFMPSAEAIKKSLPSDEQDRFWGNFTLLYRMTEVHQLALREPNQDPNVDRQVEITASIIKEMAGKTAKQINEQAERYLKDPQEKARFDEYKEVLELMVKKGQHELNEDLLQLFKITQPQFLIADLVAGPSIRMTIKNNAKFALKEVSFESTLNNFDGSVTLVKDNNKYVSVDALMPGDEATWTVPVDTATLPWSAALDAPKNAVLSIHLYRLVDTQNNIIANKSSENIFSENEATRLAWLKKKHR